MKSWIQIGVVMGAMLVLATTPVRQRLAALASPTAARVELAVQHRFPALVALRSLWVARSVEPRRPQSCGLDGLTPC